MTDPLVTQRHVLAAAPAEETSVVITTVQVASFAAFRAAAVWATVDVVLSPLTGGMKALWIVISFVFTPITALVW